MSVAILVAYMKKQKSRLRKVRRGYWRRKKQEDARRMNAQFELDPRRVYSDFRRLIDDPGEMAKPKYVRTGRRIMRVRGTCLAMQRKPRLFRGRCGRRKAWAA